MTYRDVADLEDLTLPELLPGLVEEITKLSDFAAVIFPRIKVTSRPSLKLNRLTGRGSAAWLDGACLVETSSPSSSPEEYFLKDVATAFDVCMPLADKYSTETGVVETELLQGVLRMAETLEAAFVVGTGQDGQPSGLLTEVNIDIDVDGAVPAGDVLVAMDLAFQRARPKRDMIWLAHPDAQIAFLKAVREEAGAETMVSLMDTGRQVIGYNSIPMVISEYCTAETVTLCSLAEEGFNAYLGLNQNAKVGNVFGLRGPISKQGSLVDQWQIFTSALSFIKNRQTAITLIDFD